MVPPPLAESPVGGGDLPGLLVPAKDARIAAEAAPVAKAELARAAKPKAAKPRIDCIDGCRFALVLPIIIGHFIRFGTDRTWLLKLLTQENVLVGGFFIISGYVTGYVSTNIGERSHDMRKLAEPELFFWQKVMSYYPLHALVSTAFAPMFMWVDVMTKSWRTAGLHAFLNYSLLQAWFPSEAEIWNPPIWFLSSLTFVNLTMPAGLPLISGLSKDGLRKLLRALMAMSMLGKVSYSTAWKFICGNFKERPSLPHLWNVTRFHPFWALVDVYTGIVAVRDVMLDEPSDRQGPVRNPLWYFLGSYASLGLRLTRLSLNDAMVRCCFFTPLYMRFLTAMHRDSAAERPHAITRFFGSRLMARLGALAFPMFVLHGPLGQLFYKRTVAKKLWGRVMPKSFFPVYLLLVIGLSHLINEGFVKSKRVQQLSASLAKFLARRTEGMMQDRGRVVSGAGPPSALSA